MVQAKLCCPGACPFPAAPSLLWAHPGHALAQMLSALSLVTLSGFTLSSQVQLGLRAGVLGTSSSSDYPSLPPSARESRAGCFHPPAPAVTAQPRGAEESPLGKGFRPLPAPDMGGAARGGDRDQPWCPLPTSLPCSTKAAAPALPQGTLGSPEQHLGKAPSSHPTLEQSIGRTFQSSWNCFMDNSKFLFCTIIPTRPDFCTEQASAGFQCMVDVCNMYFCVFVFFFNITQ